MRRYALPVALAALVVIAMLSLIQVASGETQVDPVPLQREEQGGNIREISGPLQRNSGQQANIGFIDSPSATCYQPDPGRNECFLTWYYASVNAAPNYMITMTLALNASGTVAHTQGFFQTSMYVPYNMLGQGFKVPCGAAGEGGDPQFGLSYAYSIRARDSANLSSANYGTFFCPAYP